MLSQARAERQRADKEVVKYEFPPEDSLIAPFYHTASLGSTPKPSSRGHILETALFTSHTSTNLNTKLSYLEYDVENEQYSREPGTICVTDKEIIPWYYRYK